MNVCYFAFNYHRKLPEYFDRTGIGDFGELLQAARINDYPLFHQPDGCKPWAGEPYAMKERSRPEPSLLLALPAFKHSAIPHAVDFGTFAISTRICLGVRQSVQLV